MARVQVGSRVKVNPRCLFSDLHGRTGTVVQVHPSDNFSVRFDGDLSPSGRTLMGRSLDVLSAGNTPPTGMTPDDLANEVERSVKAAVSRVKGTGADQYSNSDGQKFEKQPVSELLEMAREEAQDLMVYAVMTDIRLARIQAAIKGQGL